MADPIYLRAACEASLRRLRIDYARSLLPASGGRQRSNPRDGRRDGRARQGG